MKKYILKAAIIALFAGGLVSCEEDTVTYGGQNFVTFEKVETTRLIAIEDKGEFATPINLAFPRSTDLVVTVDVDPGEGPGAAVEGTDFTVPSRTIVIPAGQTTANFIINAIDNNITNDSKVIEVTITETNDSSVAVGISDIGSPYKRLVLLNDDCPTRFSDLLGEWIVKDASGEVLGKAQVDINDNGDCDVLRISGVVQNILPSLETDTYIEVTLKPGTGATAKTKGQITSYQQIVCQECWTNSQNGNAVETWLITPGGTFNTLTPQIVLTGTFEVASGFFEGGISSQVVLSRPESN